MSNSKFNPAYTSARPDISVLVPEGTNSVLDVGCSTGDLGASLKNMGLPRVCGVERDPEMGAQAAGVLDKVVVGDAGVLDLATAFEGEKFDCLIFADVLEHIEDPWSVLERARAILATGGCVVLSIPNIQHFSTWVRVFLLGYWPYRDRGIHDRTHLRFFTLRNVRELCAGAGFRIDRLSRQYRIIERPHRLNRVARFLVIPGLRGWLTFQYLVVARPADSGHNPPRR
jgi:2-polyprenyl-3-methyl-5-hydroxy-6-metoxy-1,4-benzoquinol methylase